MSKTLMTNEPESTRLNTLLPVLEFAVGSCGLSRKQALIELGFPEGQVDGMMEARLAEDISKDPRVRAVIGEYVIKGLGVE